MKYTAFLLLLLSGNLLSAQAIIHGPVAGLTDASPVRPGPDRFANTLAGNTGDAPGMAGVQFTYIKARRAGRQIQILWEAASVEPVQHFSVERSSDGSVFEAIGHLAPRNRDGACALYDFSDEPKTGGTWYYRVRATEISGSHSYSALIRVAGLTSGPVINLYPNPVTGKRFTMELSNLPAGTYVLTLHNTNGAEQFRKEVAHTGGSWSGPVELPASLVRGSYFVRVSGEGRPYLQQYLLID